MSESDINEDVGIQRVPGRFERSAAERIRDREFPLAVRGYDRQAVDSFLDEVADLVSDLESRQSREAVVQRALDEVGVETAGILQRAHETADEIAARSRAQAEGRIQRAEREAEIARRQAEDYSEKVVVDTQLLWEERQRLLEEIRQLADEVLATADEAAERVSLPEGLTPAPATELEPEALPPEAEAADPSDPPTADVELDLLPGGASDEPAADPALGEANGTGSSEQPTEIDSETETDARLPRD
ncbi:MAG TPA: DivIVA domain-containing protein [Thermoleophilaceae bacterium]|jgi:cell division initiation protein|nr:DivIVA domain-containing protein [Thermoleophilaceae bacterium]